VKRKLYAGPTSHLGPESSRRGHSRSDCGRGRGGLWNRAFANRQEVAVLSVLRLIMGCPISILIMTLSSTHSTQAA
jgi:hypothetical protein